MVTNLTKSCLQTLLQLYNKCWENGFLAGDWKEALILPLIKPGNEASKPESYRPISLTPVLCKIFERMTTNRLTWYLEIKSLINSSQSGFRKNRSTIDQLIRLHDAACKSINTNGYTVQSR